jgi:DNA polymerase III subunit beta
MKFTATVKALKTAVGLVSECVQNKPLMPILAGIKLDCDESSHTLTLTGFNLAEGLQVECDAEVIESGSIVILEKDLSSLLGKISGDIDVETSELQVKISTTNSTIELKGLDASEYPDDVFVDDDLVDYLLPWNSFKKAIDLCSVSVSNDATKQLLQGINIKSSDGIVSVASTDGHRLTVCNFPCDFDIPSTTLPNKFLASLPDTLAEEIRLSVNTNRMLFTNDNETDRIGVCRLFEGTYPDYQLLFPKSFSRSLTFNRIQAIELLNVAEIGTISNMVDIKIKSTSMSIESNRDGAKTMSSMDCSLEGLPINMRFNIKYLIQGLKMMEDELVTMNFNDKLEPCVFTSIDGFTNHLIMPIAAQN